MSDLKPLAVIETVEQLSALDLSAWGTLVMEIHHPDDGCTDRFCWVMPVVWEMVNQMGWMRYSPGTSHLAEPQLPVRLLWHPDWNTPATTPPVDDDEHTARLRGTTW